MTGRPAAFDILLEQEVLDEMCIRDRLCQACAWVEDGFAKELEHCESLGKFATPSGLPALVESSWEDTLLALERCV